MRQIAVIWFEGVTAATTQHACFSKAIQAGRTTLNAAPFYHAFRCRPVGVALALLARRHGGDGESLTDSASQTKDDMRAQKLCKGYRRLRALLDQGIVSPAADAHGGV